MTGAGTQNPPGGIEQPTYARPWDGSYPIISEDVERDLSIADPTRLWILDNTVAPGVHATIQPPLGVNIGNGVGNSKNFDHGLTKGNVAVWGGRLMRVGDIAVTLGDMGKMTLGQGKPSDAHTLYWGNATAGFKTPTGIAFVSGDLDNLSVVVDLSPGRSMNTGQVCGVHNIYFQHFRVRNGSQLAPIISSSGQSAQCGYHGFYDCSFEPNPALLAAGNFGGYGYKFGMRLYRIGYDFRRCIFAASQEHAIYNDGSNALWVDDGLHSGCFFIDCSNTNFQGGDRRNPVQLSNRLYPDNPLGCADSATLGGISGRGPMLFKQCTFHAAIDDTVYKFSGHLGTITIKDCVAVANNAGGGVSGGAGLSCEVDHCKGVHYTSDGIFALERIVIDGFRTEQTNAKDDHINLTGVKEADIYLRNWTTAGGKFAIGMDSKAGSGNTNLYPYSGAQTIRLHLIDPDLPASQHACFLTGIQGKARQFAGGVDGGPTVGTIWSDAQIDALGVSDGSSQYLMVDPGSYALIGQQASLKHSKRLVCEAGSYALTGEEAGLIHNVPGSYTIIGERGIYRVFGEDASFKHGRRLVCEAGSYALTGNDVHLLPGLEAGSYGLTGQPATLKHGRRLVCEAGSYALTGEDAGLSKNEQALLAERGIYRIFGENAALRHSKRLVCEAGSYALSGQDAGLIYVPNREDDPPATFYMSSPAVLGTSNLQRAVSSSNLVRPSTSSSLVGAGSSGTSSLELVT